MRIFREPSMTSAVRGETQVWTVEAASQAEAEFVWEHIRTNCIADLLHWNEGADRDGVCFTIDRDDVRKMKPVAREARHEFKKVFQKV